MVSTSDALVAVADSILARIDQLSAVEISKKGRKYKFVNNNFQRIQEEDKHLIVHPEDPAQQLSAVLAYHILTTIADDILTKYRDVCLMIVGVARELERNHWYEEENSSVINYKVLKFSVDERERAAALAFAAQVTPEHLLRGYNLLYCLKLNFLHTDHHVGTKLEGQYMREYVQEYFGEEALDLPEVLVALKSFVHWANIKGLLHRLEVPNMDVDAELAARFAHFPPPPPELVANVFDRYPSGTSKYSLIRKAMDILADFKYAKLVPWPRDEVLQLGWLFELCHSIEVDPVRFHLRSVAKRLLKQPVNLNELLQAHERQVKALLLVVSLVLNTFADTGGDYLLQNLKIPAFSDDLIAANLAYYAQLVDVANKIDDYEHKAWAADDIVLRLYTSEPNVYDEVMKMRELHAEDYE